MSSAQIISNAEKVRNGQEVKHKVLQLLEALLSDELIVGFDKDVSHAHKNYKYDKQFKCDFIIETVDRKFILIRASNSFRSDRIKIPFYDFLGIQQYSAFSGNIVASILLFPDGEEENSQFVNTRTKMQNGHFFSPATHWLTFSELYEFFYNYCSEVESRTAELEDLLSEKLYSIEGYAHSFADQLCQVKEESGSYYGKVGNKFERFLVEQLNSLENLTAYKNNQKLCLEYDIILDSIIYDLKIDRLQINALEATDTITKLQNGGSPKTDIHLKVFTSSKVGCPINISVKNTKSSRVSCHDYQAKDFTRVIAPNDDSFNEVVETFQEAGSWGTYESLLIDKMIPIDTDAVLNAHMEKLIEWAITGKHDSDHLIEDHNQIANFILTRNAVSGICKMQSTNAYMSELKEAIGSARGAPFSWTYPSKRRGKRIQLKMPISLNRD